VADDSFDIPAGNEELAVHPTAFAPDLLRDKVVLISGGGSGMGRATAWLAARLGAAVIVCGRNEDKLVAVVEAMRAADLDADFEPLDIREKTAVERATETLWNRYGRIDLLINSAGGQFPQAALDFSERGWNAVVNTNLNGTWWMMQAHARKWRELGGPGSIVNIVVVPRGLHGVAHTVAARAGVVALSEAVSVEWAPYDIRVNCIAPGSIRTEGWAVYSPEARARYPRTNPLQTAGTPWQIAEAAIFLGGPTGGFITGETLTIDGGGQHWGEIWTTDKPEYFRDATRALEALSGPAPTADPG
jgi:citronellol/citronellal dehydrogenase